MHPIRLVIPCLLIVAMICINFFPASAAAPKRIALLPFKINSAQDLSFLKDGIFDMLSSRLSRGDQVEVLPREQIDGAVQAEAASGNINETAARRIGTRLNADFVLFGSLTVLGENVSIDAKMIDLSGTRPTMAFFDQSQDLGAVISKINLIAADINDKMFGQTQASTTPAAPAPVAAAPAAPKKSSVHEHPEKILQQDGFIGSGRAEDVEILGINRRADATARGQLWRSTSFKHLINGITLGDVDGDGKIETVTVAPHSVYIFRSEGGTFRRIAEIKQSSNKYMIGVDSADINENGYAEIFVTSLNAEKKLVNSFVLEFDGQKYTKLIDNSRWYYRVANTPNRGMILLGQRPKSGKPSAGAINELNWQNREYVPTDAINTPRNTNVLGLSIGDVLNNGQETTVAYRSDDRILAIKSSGSTLWNASEQSGGSMLYYNAPLVDRGQVENKMYYPLRLLVWHNKGPRTSEVITVKNHDMTNRKLEYRKFTKTEIMSLIWDGVGLAPQWKTRQFSGFIQDFNVGDFDNDGQDELVAALVIKEGRVAFVSDAKSTILGYELTGPSE